MPDIDFQKIELNLIPKQGDEPVVFYASQYETARPFIADLFWGESEFTPGDSCWAEIDIRKVDDNLVVITDDVTIDNNEVSVLLPIQAVTCVGKNFGQVKIYADDDTLVAALNFILEVQPDPLANGVQSETAIDNLATQIDEIISGEGYVKDTDLDVLQSDWDEADPTSPAYIKNKPSSGTQVQADWDEADTTSPAYIQNKPTIPAAQIQSDYAQTNSGAVDFIKNKPVLPFEDKGQYLIETTPATKRSIEFTTLIGGTCGVNQLANYADFRNTYTSNGITITNNNDGSFSINGTASANIEEPFTYTYFNFVKDHVYYCRFSAGGGSDSTYRTFLFANNANTKVGTDYGNGTILKAGTYTNQNLLPYLEVVSGTAIGSAITYYPQYIDLTAYFGSTTIADYAYTLESGTAGAGITWLKNNGFFGADYYPYNAGGLLSVKTSKKINRDADNNIIGEYPLDGSRKVHRGFSIVDLGSLNWNYNSADAYFYSTDINTVAKPNSDSINSLGFKSSYDLPNNCLYVGYMGNVYCGYQGITDVPTFITTVTGKYFVYELATPFDETVSNPELRGILMLDSNNNLYYYGDTCNDFTNPQIVDANGTEEFVDGRTVEMPVGHDTFYIPMN
jgi:hypothetical protein